MVCAHCTYCLYLYYINITMQIAVDSAIVVRVTTYELLIIIYICRMKFVLVGLVSWVGVCQFFFLFFLFFQCRYSFKIFSNFYTKYIVSSHTFWVGHPLSSCDLRVQIHILYLFFWLHFYIMHGSVIQYYGWWTHGPWTMVL